MLILLRRHSLPTQPSHKIRAVLYTFVFSICIRNNYHNALSWDAFSPNILLLKLTKMGGEGAGGGGGGGEGKEGRGRGGEVKRST